MSWQGRAGTARRRFRLPNAAVSLLLAAGLVLVAFPEVVFLGGSLSPSGLDDTVNRGADRRAVQVYPNLEDDSPQIGVRDIGARTWQLVPATEFMHRAIWDGQSPFWNPYSAAGSLGVETIVDIKLSPVVVSIALLGASATAFTFVTLAFLVLALYCLQQFFARTLATGRIAATAGCIVFLLNGFAASEINSQIGAAYVLFPVVLYTLAEQLRVGGPGRFVLAVTAYIGLICTTFWTVAVLMLLLVHGVVLLLDVSRWHTEPPRSLQRRVVGVVGRQAIVPVVAILATAYVWLPVVDVLRQGGGDIAEYGQRTLRTKDPLELLTILTPSHVFYANNVDSYSRYLDPYYFGSWTVHLGIAPLMLLAAAWPRATGLRRRLLLLTFGLGLFGLVQHVGVPMLKEIGEIPGLRAIGQLYWGSLAAGATALAVGLGVAAIAERGASVRGVLIAGAGFGTAFMIALYGTRRVSLTRTATASIVAAFLLILVVIALVVVAAYRPARRRVSAMLAVALVGLELLAYQPHVRVRRVDLDDPVPRYVAFLREHVHEYRILNAGRAAIYPEWGTVLGIPQIETLNTTQLPYYRDFFFRYVNPHEPGRFLQIGERNVPFAAEASALDLLSVRYLVVDESMSEYEPGVQTQYPLALADHEAGIRVYENPDPFPRAYLSPVLVRERPPPQLTAEQRDAIEVLLRTGQLSVAPAFSRATTSSKDSALVAAARRAGIPEQGSDATNPGTARVTHYRNDEVRVEVDAARPAVLVLTDTYHKNWEVTVDGHERHLGRVNKILRGVVVPAGHSTVVFRYDSRQRELGALVSLTTIVATLAVTTAQAWRRRRAQRLGDRARSQ